MFNKLKPPKRWKCRNGPLTKKGKGGAAELGQEGSCRTHKKASQRGLHSRAPTMRKRWCGKPRKAKVSTTHPAKQPDFVWWNGGRPKYCKHNKHTLQLIVSYRGCVVLGMGCLQNGARSRRITHAPDWYRAGFHSLQRSPWGPRSQFFQIERPALGCLKWTRDGVSPNDLGFGERKFCSSVPGFQPLNHNQQKRYFFPSNNHEII